jgi:FimV-like protein
VRQFNLILAIILSYASLVGYGVTPISAEETHTYGPIKAGDMLWTIAGKVSPPSVSRHQVVLALQQANPHAFSMPCNFNSLKLGETLHIPSLTEIQAFIPEKAIAELNRQNKEWQNRRQKKIVCPPIAQPTAEKTSPQATEEPQQASSAKAAALKTTSPQEVTQSTTNSAAVATVQPEQATTESGSATTAVNVAQTPTPEVTSPSQQKLSVSPDHAATSPTAPPNNQLALVPEVENEATKEQETQLPSPTIPITREPSQSENNYLLNGWNSPKLIALFTIGAIILVLLSMGLRKKAVKRKLAKNEMLENYTFSEPLEEMPLQFDQPDKPSR